MRRNEMEKQEAKASLIWIERWLESVIAELSEIKDEADGQFAYGEKVAYTECYEKLEIWKEAKKYGWEEDIEKKFPL